MWWEIHFCLRAFAWCRKGQSELLIQTGKGANREKTEQTGG